MSAYDFNPPTEEELALLLGPEPDFSQAPEPEPFHANLLQRFMENLALQGGGQASRAPRGFGEGLASGLMGGLAAGGRRVAGARQAFQARQVERTKALDAERLKATEGRRTAKRDVIRDAYKTHGIEKTKQAEYERDNPIVTPELKGRYPSLARIPEGERLDAETFRKVKQSMLPESPADIRARDAAGRSIAAAERAAAAAERQGRVAESTIIGKLVDDYRADPSIAAYRTAQQNLGTIKQASKEPSGFGDLAMLIAYVRATEPGVLSVVRQEELQNVGQAVGKLQQYVNIPNQWVSGQRLTPQGRKSILSAAQNLAGSQKSNYEKSREIFKRRAERLGVDPTLIMQEFGAGDSSPVDPRQFESP